MAINKVWGRRRHRGILRYHGWPVGVIGLHERAIIGSNAGYGRDRNISCAKKFRRHAFPEMQVPVCDLREVFRMDYCNGLNARVDGNSLPSHRL